MRVRHLAGLLSVPAAEDSNAGGRSAFSLAEIASVTCVAGVTLGNTLSIEAVLIFSYFESPLCVLRIIPTEGANSKRERDGGDMLTTSVGLSLAFDI